MTKELLTKPRRSTTEHYKVNGLRKSTNTLLTDLIHTKVNTHDAQMLIVVGEVSNKFLAYKNSLLERLYRTNGMATYTQMNHHLRMVGDALRADRRGRFRPIDHQRADTVRQRLAGRRFPIVEPWFRDGPAGIQKHVSVATIQSIDVVSRDSLLIAGVIEYV